MQDTTKTFWRFLFENLSIIKTWGLLLVVVYSLVSIGYIVNTVLFFFQAQYTEWVVQENIQRTYTCYTRYNNSHSCTDFNTIVGYFDASWKEEVFQTIILESQKTGTPFVVLYNQEWEITLLEQFLILWFQIFIFSTMIPMYLMIYNAYMHDAVHYKKWEKHTHKNIFKKWMILWVYFIAVSFWFWWSVFLYFWWDKLWAYWLFLVCAIVAYNAFRQLKN